ncbi:conserved exported hypothetical protein [Burkholderiales bacterium]|nr:conserved exported hypothetical protein [Burkholderiales bacterium]
MSSGSVIGKLARRSPAALCALLAALVLGCAQVPPAEPRSAVPASEPRGSAPPGALYSMFHRPLKAPEAGVEVLRLRGQGSQIFRCESQAAGPRWIYRLPEAELRDVQGELVVHHGANLSFEHVDGSRVFGEIVDHVPSPNDDSLPWLLLKTRAYGPGALSVITYVERINTVGGMPPARCEAAQLNQVLRVPFSADFVFFR